jgi:DNA-binding SARP family transcriptional activator/GAF domain-containing protein
MMRLLDVLPAYLMAILACWLGLSLLLRAPRDRTTRLFAWLCLNLTLYGLAVTLARLTASAAVRQAAEAVQVVETVILPPVFLHFTLVLANVGAGRAWQRAALLLSYAAGLVLSGYALLSPAMLRDAGGLRFPPGPLTWLWLAQRALPLLLALVLVALSYRNAGDDDLERRRRAIVAIAALTGVSGALLASVARTGGFTQAPGHALMDAGLALMAYGVLAYRMLLPPRVARRAFYRSLLAGLLTAAYAAAIILLEPWVGAALGIDTPLVTVLGLVILVALFGPLRDGIGAWLDRRFFHREFDFGQLLRAVGDDLFARGSLDEQLQAGLSAICRTLGLRAGAVAVREGGGLRLAAAYGPAPAPETLRHATIPAAAESHHGDWAPWPAARLLLPLHHGSETLGLLLLGAKRSGAPYRDVERVLLASLGAYLALAIRHSRTQQEEELAMAALAEQSRQLQAAQELLAAQAEEAARAVAAAERAPDDAVPPRGLRVSALGPLRVERDGTPIERWGGDKAGTYQAEALFAFLFDRRGRGLTKDEAEELIWPDLPIDRADMAFHRTISGLRRALEPGLRRGNESRIITYHHERYWLDPSSIAWSDTDAFAAAVERGHTLARQGDLEGAREAFRQALALYRGEYMDDCPFFGDSPYVEERRAELRDQQVGALVALAAIYEQLGQPGEAATCYRRAIAASPEELPRAVEALARLAVLRAEG